ncbi:hypothetical protein LTR94_035224, partial [Friedmanniomyces endolithicus]
SPSWAKTREGERMPSLFLKAVTTAPPARMTAATSPGMPPKTPLTKPESKWRPISMNRPPSACRAGQARNTAPTSIPTGD